MLLQCRLALVFLTAFGQLLSAHSAAVAPRDVSQSISEGEGGPAGGATGAATTIEAPEYVRDLYNDMTNRSAPTDQRLYNTIRTFETTANEGKDILIIRLKNFFIRSMVNKKINYFPYCTTMSLIFFFFF